MDTSIKKYVMRWPEKGPPKRIWYIFGLDTTGRFYGEVRWLLENSGYFRDLTGTLSSRDAQKALELIERIKNRPNDLTPRPNYGVLAEGPRGNATIIFRPSESTEGTPSHDDFLCLAEIIMRHAQLHGLLEGDTDTPPTINSL
jgi:hypothetical protein